MSKSDKPKQADPSAAYLKKFESHFQQGLQSRKRKEPHHPHDDRVLLSERDELAPNRKTSSEKQSTRPITTLKTTPVQPSTAGLERDPNESHPKPDAPAPPTDESNPPQPETAPAPEEPVEAEPAPYEVGTILRLETQIAIFKEWLPKKDYDIVWLVGAQGEIDTRGLRLAGYKAEILGRISAEVMKHVESSGRCNRGLLIAHLNDSIDPETIPVRETTIDDLDLSKTQRLRLSQPSMDTTQKRLREARDLIASESAPTSGAKRPATRSRLNPIDDLRRGQWISIGFGARAWEAVFWGRDLQGAVLVYPNRDTWSMMRLDLDKMRRQVKPLGRVLTTKEIDDVVETLFRSEQTRY